MKQKRLLIYGDVELDILLKTGSVDPAGHDVKVEEVTFSPGGSAANCAAVAGHLGVPVSFLGSVGSDEWGNKLLKELRHCHVETSRVRRGSGSTGTCVAAVGVDGDRRFFSYRGVNESAPPPIPPAAYWKRHHCLHLSGYSFQQPNGRETAWALFRQARLHGLEVSLDPSYFFAKEPVENLETLLTGLDFFFPNLEEASLLSGNEDPLIAARELRKRGVKTVVITLGAEGCLLSTAEQELRVKMLPPSAVVDSTGAGDAFCAGFYRGYLGGFNLPDVCKLGCAAAAFSVTRMGAHEHAPDIENVRSVLCQNGESALASCL